MYVCISSFESYVIQSRGFCIGPALVRMYLLKQNKSSIANGKWRRFIITLILGKGGDCSIGSTAQLVSGVQHITVWLVDVLVKVGSTA